MNSVTADLAQMVAHLDHASMCAVPGRLEDSPWCTMEPGGPLGQESPDRLLPSCSESSWPAKWHAAMLMLK